MPWPTRRGIPAMQQLPLISDMSANELAEDYIRTRVEIARLERLIEIGVMFEGDHQKLELYEECIEFQIWLLKRGKTAAAKLRAGHDQAAARRTECQCCYCVHDRRKHLPPWS